MTSFQKKKKKKENKTSCEQQIETKKTKKQRFNA